MHSSSHNRIQKPHHMPKYFNLQIVIGPIHWHQRLFDTFHNFITVQMCKFGSPRLSGRCFPSAYRQKLKLTLFWTGRDEDTKRKAHSFMAGNQHKYAIHTQHTPLTQSPTLTLFHVPLLTPVLHGSHYKTRGVVGIYHITGKNHTRRTGIRVISLVRLINWCISVSTLSAPHTREIAELRRVKLGNVSGFSADQSAAVCASP